MQFILAVIFIFGCRGDNKNGASQGTLDSIDIKRGEITLCGSGTDQFGSVEFALSCAEKVRPDFNLATAMLHSFEYTEAEKVFARVIDADPSCVMAYWGVAKCNFHPLWAPPGIAELKKGAKIIALARSIIKDPSSREAGYIEAIASIYDQWESLDYRTRLKKFEVTSQKMYETYPLDKEAAVFYALALGASADPSDKTFSNQKKAGDILNNIFLDERDHPGIAHYIIHNYDYPELAELGLPAARKYAAIAAASAHAQHMPSHIFTRLGLWDESIQSNINSVSAAQCYAQNSCMQGHWDEELHGLDYLTYAYLQQGNDVKAQEQVAYLNTIAEVFPINFKDAYSFAAMPARYALERKDWEAAFRLELAPAEFPWENFLWEQANVNFSRVLGAVHLGKIRDAKKELEQLQAIHAKLLQAKENYKANLVLIQIKASEGWIRWAEGQPKEALKLMTDAADMEDATAKHPVTPGEIIPARELLGDLNLACGDALHALEAYEEDLKRHPGRFNGLYGAGLAAEKSGDVKKARKYYEQLYALTAGSVTDRQQMLTVESFMKKHN